MAGTRACLRQARPTDMPVKALHQAECELRGRAKNVYVLALSKSLRASSASAIIGVMKRLVVADFPSAGCLMKKGSD